MRLQLRASVFCGAALFASMLSCGGDQAVTNPGTNGSTLFWSLTLDQHAVNLSTVSPYDTAHVVATPRTSDGSVYPDAPAVQFVSSDLEHVQVSADGTLQAIAPGAGIAVIAKMSVGNLTHSDTVMVDVVGDSAPPVLQSLSIHPVPPDSAVWGANALENLTFVGSRFVVAHDDAGTPLSGFSIYFHSSDSTIATIDRSTGELNGKRPGQVTIVASTLAFGVAKADSIPFTITMPAFMAVIIAPPAGTLGPNLISDPDNVTIAAGGTILFWDFSLSRINITFPDPSVVAEDQLVCFCGSGNIDTYGADTVDLDNDYRARSFPVPGTYVYTVTGGPNTFTGTFTVAPPPVSPSRVPDVLARASAVPSKRVVAARTTNRKVAGGSR